MRILARERRLRALAGLRAQGNGTEVKRYGAAELMGHLRNPTSPSHTSISDGPSLAMASVYLYQMQRQPAGCSVAWECHRAMVTGLGLSVSI